MASLAEIRQQHPEYGDLSDQQLADGLYRKFYSDMPRDQFDVKVGLNQRPGGTQGIPEASALTLKSGQPVQAPNPQASSLPGPLGQFQNTTLAAQNGLAQGLTLGFGDEIAGTLMTPIQMGVDAVQGKGFDPGASWKRAVEGSQDFQEQATALNPGVEAAFELGGGIMNPLGRATMGAKLPKLVKAGALLGEGAGLGAVYGAGKGRTTQERLEGAKYGAMFGAGAGVAAPVLAKVGGKAIQKFAQGRATQAAIKAAPDAADLSAAGAALFKTSKSAGVGVKPDVFGNFATNLARKAHAADIDHELDAGAWHVYERMIDLARQGFTDPGALSLGRLHNLRQLAQDVAIEAKKPRVKKFAGDIIDGLDGLMANLKTGDMTFPPGLLGGSGAKNAPNMLLDGISTWARARRVSMVEKAIENAQNYPSGLESGLRNQFASLLKNKQTSKLFTDAEREAIRHVVGGTLPIKALRTLGIFRGVGGAVLGSLFGGPWGAAVGGALGFAGRTITEKAAVKAAQRAAKVVATPNIPNIAVPKLAPPVAPLAIGAEMGRRHIQGR